MDAETPPHEATLIPVLIFVQVLESVTVTE
jgi:hypothetical protein